MAAPTEAQLNALYAIGNDERPDGRVSIPLALLALLTWASELEALEQRARIATRGPCGDVAQYILDGVAR